MIRNSNVVTENVLHLAWNVTTMMTVAITAMNKIVVCTYNEFQSYRGVSSIDDVGHQSTLFYLLQGSYGRRKPLTNIAVVTVQYTQSPIRLNVKSSVNGMQIVSEYRIHHFTPTQMSTPCVMSAQMMILGTEMLILTSIGGQVCINYPLLDVHKN